MSKRNFILLIIILVLAVAAGFGFLFFREPATEKEEGAAEDTNFISQFNPFGSKPANKSATTSPETPNYEPGDSQTLPGKLMKVSSMPVAGFTIFKKDRLKEVPAPTLGEVGVPTLPTVPLGNVGIKKPDTKPVPPPIESVSALRYVDRATGNIYQTFADKIEERKFSSTIIPQVYEAYFGKSGESVIMRYLKSDKRTIETFVGILPKEFLGGDTENNNEVKGSFLPNNVQDISLSPDLSKIFYLFNSGNNIIGTTLNLSNNKKTQIFDSQFTEWLSFWPNGNMITLSTKPSYAVPGYMYTIDSAGKNLKKIMGDINGLTTLTSPSGKLVLYGASDMSLNIYNPETRGSATLGIKTLPEKCVWVETSDVIYCSVPKTISAAGYPDSWYQGEVSFSDRFWKIDVKTGNATLLLDPITITRTEEIDGIKLSVDENEDYLLFVNKKDSFLWKLDLK